MTELYQEYKELLEPLIAIPSISTDSVYKDQVQQAAEYLSELCHVHGIRSKVEAIKGNPLVVGEYIHNPHLPTCLVYGHYDVQPADPEGWLSNPFTLTERNERLYGRGVVDNKGQLMVLLTAIFELIKKGKLAYNFKFLFEGDEETGSPHLGTWVEAHKEKLAADFILVSDGMQTWGVPALEVGFRGACNLALSIQTSPHDLHSGLFGGAVPNAAQILTGLVASLYDQEGKVTVPGFYEGIADVAVYDLPSGAIEQFIRAAAVQELVLHAGKKLEEALGLQPTLEVTTLKSGYLEQGYRNAIPGRAVLKMNIRSAPGQNLVAIQEKLKAFIADHLPAYVQYRLEFSKGEEAVLIDGNNQYIERARAELERVYGQPALVDYCGGTLPVAQVFANTLKVPQVMLALANADCHMHGAEENFRIQDIESSLNLFLNYLS